jgi:CubicO group peptidase (beta-lactamase class C family)
VLSGFTNPVSMLRFARFAGPVLLALMLAPSGVSAQAAVPNAVRSFGVTLTRAKPAVVGMTNRLIPRLDSIIKAAIADHATPGATIAVARRGRIVLLKGYGHTDWAKGAPRATDSTMYDLASLTKVVATTTAAMILEEEGKLDLDRTVASYLNEYDVPDKRTITVRMLLTHTSGIRSNFPLWTEAKGREQYFAGMVTFPLVREPGSAVEYTDWNMVLTAVHHRAHHRPDARPVRAVARVRAARHAGYPVQPVRCPQASHRTDGNRGLSWRPGVGGRSRRDGLGAGRCFRQRRSLFECAGPRRVRADAAEWRLVRPAYAC